MCAYQQVQATQVADTDGVPSLGAAVKQRRNELGLTQEELAARLGVHKMTVVKYENGSVQLSIDRAADVAKALEMPLTMLLVFGGYDLEVGERYQVGDRSARPDFVVREPGTGRLILLEFKDGFHRPENLEVLQKVAESEGVELVYVDSNDPDYEMARARSSSERIRAKGKADAMYDNLLHPSRLAQNLPYSVRVFLDEFRLRITKAGATEEEVERAMQLLRSPSLFTWYSVGTPRDLPEEKVLQGMQAVAESVIIPELRQRGRDV